jgi:ATP-binding cassette, subfamily B, bacterial HlyB/CyaB
MLRCAKELGLKARARLTTWERLASTPLPAIVALRDGGFLLLGKVGDGKALVQSPLSPRAAMMTRAEFEAAWDGHLVLMTRRAGLVDLSHVRLVPKPDSCTATNDVTCMGCNDLFDHLARSR